MNLTMTPMTDSSLTGSSQKKLSQTEEQLNLISTRLQQLGEVIGYLETKLNVVLRPDIKGEGDEMRNPEQELIPLAGNLKKIGEKIRYYKDSIQDIIERIEI